MRSFKPPKAKKRKRAPTSTPETRAKSKIEVHKVSKLPSVLSLSHVAGNRNARIYKLHKIRWKLQETGTSRSCFTKKEQEKLAKALDLIDEVLDDVTEEWYESLKPTLLDTDNNIAVKL